MWLLLLVCILPLLLYIIFNKHKHWERRGIPGPNPLPLVGNLGSSLIGWKHITEVFADIYHKYDDLPFVGIYRMGQPCLVIRDPEIIKNVIIKDFGYFSDNDILVDKDKDPLIARNLFALKGDEWKKTRQFISHNFASGKIKLMFPLAERVGKNMIVYLEKTSYAGKDAIDAKSLFTKFTCDVVALCGFGINGRSFEDANSEFLNLASKFMSPNSLQSLKFVVSLLLPQFFSMKLLPKSFEDGVISLVNETYKYRQQNNIKRNDVFEAISQTESISLMDTAAHMANFIIDGYETSSLVMTFVLYELGANTECQIKLRQEITSILKKFDGQFTYEAMQEMNYLEACINETMRLHPAASHLSKVCTQPYTMTSSGNDFRAMNVTLEKGSPVIISLLGLHKDVKYFNFPEKFMPERFIEKSDSFKNVYIPFSNGPRMCIGSRFGLMQIKIAIVHLIKNFEITLDKRTKQPIQYDPFYFLLFPKGGVWFKFKKIVSSK